MNSYSVTIRAVSQQTFTILAEDETEASHLAHEQFDPDPSVVRSRSQPVRGSDFRRDLWPCASAPARFSPSRNLYRPLIRRDYIRCPGGPALSAV